MHSLSHLVPKNSIYQQSAPSLIPPKQKGKPVARKPYLRLQQTTLEEHQSLPPKLAHQLPQAHAQIFLPVLLRSAFPPLLLLFQAILKPLENLRITELPLRKPCRRHHTKPLTQHTEELRRICDYHNGFLYRRAGHVSRTGFEERGVHLTGAGDAKEGRRRRGTARGSEEGEVGEILRGSAPMIVTVSQPSTIFFPRGRFRA